MLAERIELAADHYDEGHGISSVELRAIAAALSALEAIARKVLEYEAAGFAPFSAYSCACQFADEHNIDKQTRWCPIHAKMRDRLAVLEAREQARLSELAARNAVVTSFNALSPDEVRAMVNAEPNPLAAENVRRGIEMVRALPRVPDAECEKPSGKHKSRQFAIMPDYNAPKGFRRDTRVAESNQPYIAEPECEETR